MVSAVRGVAMVLAGLLVAALAAAAQAETKTLVITGQSAPGAGGGTFDGFCFFDPVLNASGQAAFQVRLTGTTDGSVWGIFRGDGSTLTAIARENWPAPGAGGGTFQHLFDPVINNSGQAAFHALLNGTDGGSREAIFRGDGLTLTPIARQNWSAPGAGGGTFVAFGPGSPALNASGQAAFQVQLTGTTDGSGWGIFRGDGSTLTPIARSNWSAPGAGGGTFDGFFDPVLNASGQAAFFAFMTGTADGGREAIFRGDGSTLTPIARENWSAPGAGGGTFDAFGVGGPALNASGQVAFKAGLTGTADGGREAIFRGDGSTLTAIARENWSAPGAGGGTFQCFFDPVLNASGQVAFMAGLTGTADGSREGIFRGDGSILTAIARQNWSAPGAGGGTFYYFSSDPALNDSGQVAFMASLTGTVGGATDNAGIFLADDQECIVAVRTGDALAGSTVMGLLADPSKQVGQRRLNDYGQVAYGAGLADRREGNFLFTPELHWRGSAGGSWDTATNWTVGLAPAIVHPVIIDPVSSLEVAGPSGLTTVKSLTVGAKTAGQTATLTLSLPTGSLAVTEAAAIQATGCLNVNAGAFTAGSLTNEGTLTLSDATLSAATITNTGTIRGRGHVAGVITNNVGGIVAPGESPGILTVDDIIFAAGSMLQVELGGTARGTQYDVLAAGGTVTLQSGSSLGVTLTNGFVPQGDDEFDILDFAGLSGKFTTVSLPSLGGGLEWNTSGLYTSGTITVAPEPATLALVMLGVALLARRRR